MHLLLSVLLVTLLTSSAYTRTKCRKDDNCRLPACRCWNDDSTPGGLAIDDTPQIILVSFSYAVNKANVKDYLKIFEGLSNPNGCPAKGTFFVQGQDSDFDVVSNLYKDGHEIGVSAETGQVPNTIGEWMHSFNEILKRMREVKIPDSHVQGVRSPSLYFGGDPELWAMQGSRLSYDATCVTRNYTSPHTLLWPYTLDFAFDSPSCNIGKDSVSQHTGLWEFLMPVLEYKDIQCSTPSGCAPAIKNQFDAFRLFFANFIKHYNGNKAPFTMFLDPLWLSNKDHFLGTRQFLQIILNGFPGTWVLNYQQALQWIKHPVPLQNTTDYPPWMCM